MNKFNRKILITVICLVFSFSLYGCVTGHSNSSYYLSESEIEAKFSDHTVVGYHFKNDSRFKRYYSPDGKLYENHSTKGERVGRWHASSDGICWKFRRKTKCAIVEKYDASTYRRYNKKGTQVREIYHVFKKGNQLSSEKKR